MKPGFTMVALAAFAAPSFGTETKAVIPADPSSLNALEEIVVTGDRKLSAARKAIEDAEDRFYERWNSINEDRMFDIKCSIQTPTGTRLSHRVCEPRYVEESTEAEAQRMFQLTAAGGQVFTNSDLAGRLNLQDELRRRTLAAIRKDPELLRALLERARLEQYYTELRKEKFKGRWIVWD